MKSLGFFSSVLAALLVVLPMAAEESAPSPAPYRFEEIRSSVTLRHSGAERKPSEGDGAVAGDEVETGWFGRAVLSVPDRASRFEVLSSSKVVLGGPEPGILLRLQEGRLRAMFGKLLGKDDDRLVSAPGALLAVRGTRYGLEVDGRGNATLVVFEGTVEVRPLAGGVAPLAIGAGHACRIGRDSRCERMAMPGGMNERSWPHGGMNGMSPNDPGGDGMRPGHGHGGGSKGGHGGN